MLRFGVVEMTGKHKVVPLVIINSNLGTVWGQFTDRLLTDWEMAIK